MKSIVHGHARFSFISEGSLHFEWSPSGTFENRLSLSEVAPPRVFERLDVRRNGPEIIIATDCLQVRYLDNGAPLSRKNLNVSWSRGGLRGQWHPGKKDRLNLGGTARTLDGIQGGRVALGDGLLSRSGWSVFDDSRTPIINEKGWVEGRAEIEQQSLYFFSFGLDYQLALREAALVFGAQPLPPRYALGNWWSRYWAYTDKELEGLVLDFNRFQIPLDVLVIDMDWHLEGWTGYTWDRRYFPDPDEFLRWLKTQGVRVTLNLHPAKGIGPHEECYQEAKQRLKLPLESNAPIAFDCTDPKYMRLYFELLHRPQERRGVDFWWIDWQQGSASNIPGLDPLVWLNRQHFEDSLQQHTNRRALILSRYGGLGSGRYPVGFSGDTYADWRSLAFQPYFTATAANVLYGYWSHDIGGHLSQEVDAELYTRWIQYGIYSPIFRTHHTKDTRAERRIWAYPPQYAKIMRQSIERRYELIPYINTQLHGAYDSAISLCHPIYYHFPQNPEAYKAKDQYFFGRDLIVNPITAPRDVATDSTARSFWVPPGEWFDPALGLTYRGPQWVSQRYLLDEVPTLMRSQAIIPEQRARMRLNESSYSSLVLSVPPGRHGSCLLYEDDGESLEYQRGKRVACSIHYRRKGAATMVLLEGAQGNYVGYQPRKDLSIKLHAVTPPRKVTVNERTLPWSYRPKAGCWSYDGERALLIVHVGVANLRKPVRIAIFGSSSRGALGIAKTFRRLALVHEYVTAATTFQITHPDERLSADLLQTGNRISRNPSTFKKEIRRLRVMKKGLPKLLREMGRAVDDASRRKTIAKALKIYATLVS